ncbi:iron complex transport system substrate-binding protein [Malaciobacter marinus]|uniref:Iron complex transport system substrate-binding protein n=1 Tax=Malaciobacter marinus TaxID=505249 RepID=A0AB37A0A0_9BACT|nr:ABC transporter substrate-binding protein [Malaciobacter marinus]PPK62026.1 iron complex transport system substrate-binding protein [Malaciobacter marinus]
MRLLFLIILLALTLNAKIFVDMYDREVKITNNNKIVCLGPGTLRLITYMQLEKKLIGIEKKELRFSPNSAYSLVLDKKFIKSLPIVGQGGPGKMPNLETLISLKPDVIFTSILSPKQVALIQKKTKTPVIALSYGSNYGGKNNKEDKIEAVKKSMLLIAQIMDKQNRADELITFMNKQKEALKKITIDDKAIYVGGVAYKGLHGITSTESDYPAFKLLNIKNPILQNHIGHAFVNKETLLSFNPEIIFLDLVSRKIILEEIEKNKAIYKHIQAFKNSNIYWLYPSNFYNTNIENIYINSWLIASHFGKDIDIKKVKERVYKKFLGKDINTNVQ